MKRWSLIILAISIFSFSLLEGQEIYRWVDEKGTIHFVDDLTLVPERYRDQVQKKTAPKEPPSYPSRDSQKEEGKPETEPSRVPKDLFGRGEDWWRARVGEWEAKFQKAQKSYEESYRAWKTKEKELEESRFKPESLKRKLRVEIKGLEEKTKAFEREMQEARRMLDQVIPREAEEAKADPDWLKP